MKKKIIKLWGVGMIIVLMTSLFLVGATPVAGDDLDWSDVKVPGGKSQIAATDVAKVTVAPNGDIFVIDSNTATDIYKSTDGGYTWSKATVSGVTTLVDLAVSPSYETDGRVFAVGDAAGGVQAYYSTNSGTSYSAFSVIIDAVGAANSIAIAPNYVAGNGEMLVATTTDTYKWKDNTMSWAAAGANLLPAFDAEYSPNFPIDGTRIAAGTHAVDGAGIHTLVGSDTDWNDTLATWVGAAPAAPCELEFPSDFMASNPSARTFFVSIGADDVYRAEVGKAATLDMNMGEAPQSIAYSGTLADGILYGGAAASTKVYRCTDPDAAPASISWKSSSASPTGATATYVAAPDSVVYAGTAGAESAFSVSNDSGSHFYQTGLIHTTLTTILDMQFTSADEGYLLTNDAPASIDSLWKTGNGGSNWDRIYTVADANDQASLAISMDYGADDTLIIGDTGATGSGAFYVTNNGGDTFVPRALPGITCGPIVVKDQYNIYAGSSGGGGAVQMTANGGWTWQASATSVGDNYIASMLIDPATGNILVGDDNGGVFLSVDNNKTYKQQGDDIDTNDVVGLAFCGDSILGATTDVLARDPDTEGNWTTILNPASSIVNIGVAADGTLYVTDAGTPGTLHRTLDPTAKTVEWSTTSPTSEDTGILNLVEGSVIIFVVDPAANGILTYTDTLNQAVVTLATPEDGTVIGSPTNVTITWEAVDGAKTYQWQIAKANDFKTTTDAGAGVSGTSASSALLSAATVYYYRVRVDAPLLGPWSSPLSFETQLSGNVNPNAPAIPAAQPAANGGTGVSLNPTLYWGGVINATGYELQMGTSPTMAPSTLLVDATGSLNRLGNVTSYVVDITLEYGTNYYWRVKAVSATSETFWSNVQGFTTMVEPTETEPPVTVVQPTPTTITIDIPTPTSTTITQEAPVVEKISEGYIWAIIIIGAVLVIAVIVLIVRTRRSV